MFSPCINYLSPGFNVLCNCSNRAVHGIYVYYGTLRWGCIYFWLTVGELRLLDVLVTPWGCAPWWSRTWRWHAESGSLTLVFSANRRGYVNVFMGNVIVRRLIRLWYKARSTNRSWAKVRLITNKDQWNTCVLSYSRYLLNLMWLWAWYISAHTCKVRVPRGGEDDPP